MSFSLPSGRKISSAKALALVGIAAATLECAKLVLAFLPNVEVVTLLVALYGYVFGYLGVAAAVVFVSIEPLIYGFSSWLITYYLYWPLVALVFMLLARRRISSRWVLTLAAVLLTVFFGVLSSFIDVIFFMGVTQRFFTNLIIYYARGVIFYLVQIACNAVVFPLLFNSLAKKLKRIRRRLLQESCKGTGNG